MIGILANASAVLAGFGVAQALVASHLVRTFAANPCKPPRTGRR